MYQSQHERHEGIYLVNTIHSFVIAEKYSSVLFTTHLHCLYICCHFPATPDSTKMFDIQTIKCTGLGTRLVEGWLQSSKSLMPN